MKRPDEHPCPTCADAADRAVVRALERGDAEVEFDDGTRCTVAVDLVPGVAVGDALLVHQGVAIARVEAEPSR